MAEVIRDTFPAVKGAGWLHDGRCVTVAIAGLVGGEGPIMKPDPKSKDPTDENRVTNRSH